MTRIALIDSGNVVAAYQVTAPNCATLMAAIESARTGTPVTP